jgi:AraC-like DNA-binding protein
MHLKSKPALGGQQMIKNYLELLLMSLMRSETEKENPEAVFLPREEFGERVAEQVILFLKSNLDKKLEIADVCAGVHYNKSYVCKQFKQATQQTVMAYFTQLKIERAKRYLRETDMSVTQIAEKLAFDTPNYFSKTFKKLTSFTPLQYKFNHL